MPVENASAAILPASMIKNREHAPGLVQLIRQNFRER
jgi:hypothetical protein